jgi:N-acetylglucosamine-6-phosphate deacetylase
MIVDGEHVAPAMLGLAMRGVGRPMVVSDAMPPVGGTKAEFDLLGARIVVRDGSCRTQEGALAGSSIEMASAVRNCVRLLGLPLEQALRCASRHPAEFLGLGRSLGRLAPGYRADMAAFDPMDISVSAAWVAGERSDYCPRA